MNPLENSATPLACLLLAGFLSTSLAAQAQPCYAEFDGNVFKDNVSMGGPNYTNCIKTTVPTSVVVFAVEVFTGERTGTSTVGIWSHDAAKDEPMAEQARGSWQVAQANGWQGANLSKPVVVPGNTTIWVSWIPVNGSQASVENSGRTLPGIQVYKWSPTNAAPWNGPYQGHQWKFRLWCQPIGGIPGITVVGKGCADGYSNVGEHFTLQTPSVGNSSFSLEGKTLPPSAPALLVLGVNKNFQSFDLAPAGAPGCFLHTDTVASFGLTTTAGTPSLSDGTLKIPAGIPNNAALKGFYVRSQLLVSDGASKRALPIVFTNGLEILVQ